jgi:hypothetical protein
MTRSFVVLMTGLTIVWALAACEGGSSPDVSTDTSGTDGDSDADTDSDGDADSDADSDSDADTDGDADTTSGSGSECSPVDFEITGTTVDMLIVLDRSNSMAEGNPVLWNVMGDALRQVTSQMSQQINFGLMLFPALTCSGLSTNTCASPTSSYVDIGSPTAVTQISDAVGAVGDPGVGTCGGTPTAVTLQVAHNTLLQVSDSLERYVLLATDGAPNCNSALNGGTCKCTGTNCSVQNLNCLDDQRTYDAADALFAAGFPVYVIGVGGSSNWQTVMDQIASHGGTSQYYPAGNAAALLAAMQQITGSIVSCDFDIDWASLPQGTSTDPDLVNFYCKQDKTEPNSDANVIGLDPGCANGNGWDWVDADTIRFCDDACTKLKTGGCPVVTAMFGCVSTPVD